MYPRGIRDRLEAHGVSREIYDALSGADKAKIQRLLEYMDINTADDQLSLEQVAFYATQQRVFAQIKEKGIKKLADERKRQKEERDAEMADWVRRHGPAMDPDEVNDLFFGVNGLAWH
jgi:hypothetical protein